MMDAIPRLDSPPVVPPVDATRSRGQAPPGQKPRDEAPSRARETSEQTPHESPAETSPPREDESVSGAEQVQELVEELQEAFRRSVPEDRTVRFRPAEEDAPAHDFVIEIVDGATGELITQFPPEKILNLRHRLDELVGMVVDRKI